MTENHCSDHLITNNAKHEHNMDDTVIPGGTVECIVEMGLKGNVDFNCSSILTHILPCPYNIVKNNCIACLILHEISEYGCTQCL